MKTVRSQVNAAVLLTGVLAGMAMPAWAADKIDYPTMKTASGFSRFVQNVSGFTALSGWIVNRVVRRELGKHVQGDLASHLSLYSGTDLLGGKARKISISGRNLLVDDFIPLSRFQFENKTDMPLYVRKSSHPFLLRPVEFKVSAVMTEADINRMLQSEKGRKTLTAMKVDLPPFGPQYFDAVRPKVDIDGNRLVIESLMNIHDAPAENALPLKVSGELTAEDARLQLSDLNIEIEGIRDTEEIAQLIEHYFSELADLSQIKIDRHRVKVGIDKTELSGDQLHLEATVTVSPDPKTLKRYLASLDNAKANKPNGK